MLRQIDPVNALKAGILGTVVMTVVMYGLPVIGLPSMDIMAALGAVFPFRISPYILGSLVHFGVGIVLALTYSAFFYWWLPGASWLKGLLFSLLPWLFAITLLGPSLQFASRILGAASPMANPCAVANPCAPKTPVNPCAPQIANPCAATPNPCAAKQINPCAPKNVNPCAPGAASQGGIPPQALSLALHLVYGVVLGALYRPRA